MDGTLGRNSFCDSSEGPGINFIFSSLMLFFYLPIFFPQKFSKKPPRSGLDLKYLQLERTSISQQVQAVVIP